MFFFRSSKSAFSRHDNVRASSALFIWLNENVVFTLSVTKGQLHIIGSVVSGQHGVKMALHSPTPPRSFRFYPIRANHLNTTYLGMKGAR